MKRRGIFVKVFSYTAAFLMLLVCVTVALFSQQFLSFYNTAQTEQLYHLYQSLYEQLRGRSADEILRIAQAYSESNQTYSFYIRDSGNNIIFSTPNIETYDIDMPDSNSSKIIIAIGTDYTICATNPRIVNTDYSGLAKRSLAALAFMLAIGVAGALFFARRITEPIRRLADDTKRMANLEDVPPPSPVRRDELGDLARGVHAMYDKLKDEILRRRGMEEAQRHFFSAASHELKTPIAATSALLEGMLADVGDYRDHQKYLRECARMMDAQSRTVAEILEIAGLEDGKIAPCPEKIDIGRMAASLLPSFQALAEANGQRIAVDIPDGQFCVADGRMLRKSLSNVIMNAVQDTPPGGEIRIWVEPNAGLLRLCVLNTGARIGDDALPRLFDAFFRADKARSRKSGRSGLGLAIVRRSLESMGIEFAIANTDDGVLFWMDLPDMNFL